MHTRRVAPRLVTAADSDHSGHSDDDDDGGARAVMQHQRGGRNQAGAATAGAGYAPGPASNSGGLLGPGDDVISLATPTRRDLELTAQLDTLLHAHGLYETASGEELRRAVLGELHALVRRWVQQVYTARRASEHVVNSAGGTIVTAGSYRLGVHGEGTARCGAASCRSLGATHRQRRPFDRRPATAMARVPGLLSVLAPRRLQERTLIRHASCRPR